MSRNRPNFVIIMTDQQRGDCLGIEGRKGLMTPNLDNLAAAGVRFTCAYSATPTCIAARRTLMSGQEPATHGLVGYLDDQEWHIDHTLPGELRRTGYQTALVGRDMHLYPSRKRYGFEWMTLLGDDYVRWLDEHSSPWQGGRYGHGVGSCDRTARPWHMAEWQHPTHWTVEQALRFLDNRDPSCPFFVVVSFAAPHQPLTPPTFYFERYLRTDMGEPVIGDWATPSVGNVADLSPASWKVKLEGEVLRETYAGYYGLINHVDDQIARFLTRLQAEAKNTYVLFTSDHGEMLGDHYMWRKRVPYEGSARVPFLLAGPDIGPGTICDQPVGLQDIMPTFLELAGVPVPDTVEGASLLSLIRRQTEHWRPFIHGEHADCPSLPNRTGMHFLTDGKEKYIWLTDSGREQLFDLIQDPKECHDLAASPESAERLRKWRVRLIQELKDRPEGFTDGKQLIAGRPYTAGMPHVHGIPPVPRE